MSSLTHIQAVAFLLTSSLSVSALAQDPYCCPDMGADLATGQAIENSIRENQAGSVLNNAEPLPLQTEKQIQRNEKRLVPPEWTGAAQNVFSLFVEPLQGVDDVIIQIAESTLHDSVLKENYNVQMQRAGFEPDNVADVTTALALSTLSLANNNASGLQTFDRSITGSVRKSIRQYLVERLPATLDEQQLRVLVEHTQAEYVFQDHLWELSQNDDPDDRLYLKEMLIIRADNLLSTHVLELANESMSAADEDAAQ